MTSAALRNRALKHDSGYSSNASSAVRPVGSGCHLVGTASGPRVFVAIYDFESRVYGDLSFERGEHLEILDDSKDGWWLARSKETLEQGEVPSSYLVELVPIENEPWYFGKLGRSKAERELLSPWNRKGSYLIRDSEAHGHAYTLSVRHGNTVSHYRIRQLEDGFMLVASRAKFVTLRDLVQHHEKHMDRLKVKLRSPCVFSGNREILGRQVVPGGADVRVHRSSQGRWEIDRRSLEFIQKLGSGHFGEVWEGRWNSGDCVQTVAIKTPKSGSTDTRDFLREAHIMKNLQHPKLVRLLAVCTVGKPIYIITELIENGSLLSYLRNKNRSIAQLELIGMAAQVAEGMRFLEERRYIHRDLAARNILVGSSNRVKIADFGLARRLKDGNVYEEKAEITLPIKWTAPEAVNYSRFSTKSDVWSFGVLLYELITHGQVPYNGKTNSEVLRMLDRGYRLPCPGGCPPRLHRMMLGCWDEDPFRRPNFSTLQWKLEDDVRRRAAWR